MAFVRQRICAGCGVEQAVRKDNTALRCSRCAGRENGAKALAVIQARPVLKSLCEHCRTSYRTRPSANRGNGSRFCSMACRRGGSRLERQCANCAETFTVPQSVVNGTSNSAGRFCSRPCYEHFLCRTERVTGRGSQWKASRDQALRLNPFCALCGTAKRLQVHHIIPFRLTRDNTQRNLIPLCVKHHRFVETQFVAIEPIHPDQSEALVVWSILLRARQDVTRSVLRRIVREHKSARRQCGNDPAGPPLRLSG